MIISAENTCDLTKEKIEELGLHIVNMQLSCENENIDTNNLPIDEFYRAMRNGEVFRTSQVNEMVAREFFEKLVQEDDVLHLGFSSGQSASINTIKRVADEINQNSKHKIYVVDSLCSSAGQGFYCELVVKHLRETNCTIQELEEYANELKYDIAHYFTVDDLKYLMRGGRISRTSAILGKVLMIKPVLRLNRKGEIVSLQKVISRKKALARLVELYKELADMNYDLVNIGNGDCIGDANLVKDELLKVNPNAKINIYSIGPTIGSHSGPGTLAIFFVRKHDFYND